MYIDCWDVGQGDCSVIHLPDGRLFVIDVGPLGSPFVDWIADNPTHIHTVVITHNDGDHAGDLPSLIKQPNAKIDAVWMLRDRSGDVSQFKKIFRVVEEEHSLGHLTLGRLESPKLLWQSKDHSISIEVIFPSFPENETANSPNLTSGIIVLNVSGKAVAVWPGDSWMRTIARKLGGAEPQLLVGPHHGAPSDRKKKDFWGNAGSIQPAHLFVSVGTTNPHSHPWGDYLSHHAASGCHVACSQITKKCDPASVDFDRPVLNGSALLGLRANKKTGGVSCRGSLRFYLEGDLLRPDDFHGEHRRRVDQLKRPLCRE